MQELLTSLLSYVVTEYPIAGSVMMLLGGIYVVCDLTVNASGCEKADRWWKRVNNGYIGILLKLISRYSPLKPKV